jgi:hypothetical protein
LGADEDATIIDQAKRYSRLEFFEDEKMTSRSKKVENRKIELRKKLMPWVTDDMIWKQAEGGWRSLPRTLPYFFEIMDEMSSGHPLSKTYFALWCRSFAEMFLEIKNETEMAFESGFHKERAIYVWRKRMRLLDEIGFIATAVGPCSEFGYVQILCPYYVVEKIRKKNKSDISDKNYNGLIHRFSEIKLSDTIEPNTE